MSGHDGHDTQKSNRCAEFTYLTHLIFQLVTLLHLGQSAPVLTDSRPRWWGQDHAHDQIGGKIASQESD